MNNKFKVYKRIKAILQIGCLVIAILYLSIKYIFNIYIDIDILKTILLVVFAITIILSNHLENMYEELFEKIYTNIKRKEKIK